MQKLNQHLSEYPIDDDVIVRARTAESQSIIDCSFHSQLSEGGHRFSQSFSSDSYSYRNLQEETTVLGAIQDLDVEILSEQAKVLTRKASTFQIWRTNYRDNSYQVTEFFKDNLLRQLLQMTFQQNKNSYVQLIVLTLDYFTNIITLVLFLFWKQCQNELQRDPVEYNTCQILIGQFIADILKFRFNQLRVERIILELLQQVFDIAVPQFIEKQQKLVIGNVLETNVSLNQFNPVDVANQLTLINQNFYADLQLFQIIKQKQLDNYFKRINSLGLYIVYTIVKLQTKKERQDQIKYWLDVALQLLKNRDFEGLYCVYTMGIERLVSEYLPKMPLYFKSEMQIEKLKEMMTVKVESSEQITELIPSFHKYWVNLKRMEICPYSNLKMLEMIKSKLEKLVEISQTQWKLQTNSKQIINIQIQNFLLKAPSAELEQAFKLSIKESNKIQTELWKLAKKPCS